MLTLFRTNANIDWKGRPDHGLVALGTGTREELLTLQDADVQQWQAEDIAIDRENAADDEADGEPHREVSDVWANSYRWEMEREPDDMRSFGERNDDGDSSSICYHILDL